MRAIVYTYLILLFACSQPPSETENISTENSQEEVEVAEEIAPEDIKNGEYKEYHENGALKIEGKNDASGQRTGIWTSYYPDGTKWSESHYINGLKEGHSVTFYENGNMRYIGVYKND